MSTNQATTQWQNPLGYAHSNSQLVQQAQAGDAEAFGCLYDMYLDRIYRYIFFRVTDEQLAEDLTAQVFCKAWEHLDRYKPGGAPFVAWLYTIARNSVIDFYRTRKDTVAIEEATSLAGDGPQPYEQVELKFETDSLRTALEAVTDEQRQVLVLKFISGMTTEEISQHLGKRPGAIRALQMRGLQALSRLMEEKEFA